MRRSIARVERIILQLQSVHSANSIDIVVTMIIIFVPVDTKFFVDVTISAQHPLTESLSLNCLKLFMQLGRLITVSSALTCTIWQHRVPVAGTVWHVTGDAYTCKLDDGHAA